MFTLGWAYDKSAMLFLTSRVEKDNIGLLYSTIAVIMTIGGIVGGPIYGGLFSLGLKLSGPWLGLPFFVGREYLRAFEPGDMVFCFRFLNGKIIISICLIQDAS